MTLQGKDNTNETMEARASATRPDKENTSAGQAPSHEQIRLRAYEIYLERGRFPGNELDDWLQAEHELERAGCPKHSD